MAGSMWMNIGCLVVLVTQVIAYPSGAPDLACVTLTPQHPPTTTTGSAPFKIDLNTAAYIPGSEISGSIISPANVKFRGFLIQARSPESKNTTAPIGQFINPSNVTHTVCGEDEKQSLTHSNNTDKASVMFTWKAPDTFEGDIVFNLTIVESYDPSRFWLNIVSDTVLDCSKHGAAMDCVELDKTIKKKEAMALLFKKSKSTQNDTN